MCYVPLLVRTDIDDLGGDKVSSIRDIHGSGLLSKERGHAHTHTPSPAHKATGQRLPAAHQPTLLLSTAATPLGILDTSILQIPDQLPTGKPGTNGSAGCLVKQTAPQTLYVLTAEEPISESTLNPAPGCAVLGF